MSARGKNQRADSRKKGTVPQAIPNERKKNLHVFCFMEHLNYSALFAFQHLLLRSSEGPQSCHRTDVVLPSSGLRWYSRSPYNNIISSDQKGWRFGVEPHGSVVDSSDDSSLQSWKRSDHWSLLLQSTGNQQTFGLSRRVRGQGGGRSYGPNIEKTPCSCYEFMTSTLTTLSPLPPGVNLKETETTSQYNVTNEIHGWKI